MKYKITIEKIEVKKAIESIYISDEEIEKRKEVTPKGESYPVKNYQNIEVDKEISEQIYEQTTDNQINLKGIIDAFNQSTAEQIGGTHD